MMKQARFRIAEHFRHRRVTGGFSGHFQHQHVIGFSFARLLKQAACCQSAGDQVDMVAEIFQAAHFTGDDAVDDFFDDGVFIVEIAVDLANAQLRGMRDIMSRSFAKKCVVHLLGVNVHSQL